ncbi:MAG TPA: PAS domain S-box protein, partial [Candidatus Limnocylindrales bacterium]
MTGRLAEILDAVDSGITVQDSDLRLVYANRAAAVLSGWATAEEMIAAPVEETLERFEMIDLAGNPLPLGALPGRRALAGEDPEPVTLGFRIRATGEERWSRVHAQAIRMDDGRLCAVTTFHDLTAHIVAERASEASERRYREIVEALPVVAWFTDPDGRLVASNARWFEYTGTVALNETLDAATHMHQDDRDEFLASWDASRAQGEPFDATIRLRRHDDTHRWHQLRLVPSRADTGELHGWIGTATDIDDERRASLALIDTEREFRELTNSAPMLVWLGTRDGGRTFFNRGWLDFTGRSIGDETGGGWLERVHPDDRRRVESAAAELAEGGGRVEVEYRLQRHDGVYRWILDIGTGRFGADGEITGLVGSAVDIEERKRAADLARLMADAALRLDEVRTVEEMVEAAAAVAIPAIADWCLIDLVEADGSLRRASVVARDGATQAIVDRVRDFPTGTDLRRPAAEAIRRHEAILMEDLSDDSVLLTRTGGSTE